HVTYRGGAGYAQHVELAALAQLLAQPRMTPQFIIADHPAMRHLRTPQVEHVQTLLGTRAIRHVLGHVACLASWLAPPAPPPGRACPDPARDACDTPRPRARGMPGVVARLVPTPQAGTSGSQARRGRGVRRIPCTRPPDSCRPCRG